jgi:hypothetical protein
MSSALRRWKRSPARRGSNKRLRCCCPATAPGLGGCHRARRHWPHWVASPCRAALSGALCRRWFLHGVALAVVPPGRTALQDRVIEFAGFDTEQTPEFIWVAADDCAEWDPDVMARWCRDRSAWREPGSLAATGAERVVVMFDGQLHCWLPAAQAPALQRALQDLAQTWQLTVIDGPAELAWPTAGTRE